MNWIGKFRYRCVGIVDARTQLVDGGELTGDEWRAYWVLSENGFGWRASEYIGPSRAGSAHHYHRRAAVLAWTLGGPLPHGIDETAASEPIQPEKPRKSAEILRLVQSDDA